MQDEGNVREQGDNKRRRHEEKEAQPSGEQDGERESEEKEQPPPELGSHEESFAPPDVQPEQAAPRAASITSECLRYHNLFRVDHLREHALQPLHAHSGMDRYAVALMERVAASNCAQRSLPRDIPFGVNFYATSGTKPSCSRATHLWYRGIDSFHGRYPGTDWNRGSGLQFIQMMWSRSDKQTWDAILLRHLRWLDYGSPGARQEPPRAAISELPTGSAE
ncbi:conserved hypothetical protein [Neospora caninum Liverpool]|nr:conserved hypothetical protein [Neospora caninum Liverpool]CBZ50999.1 conserved hypothetical protein [Neospora caninum Liverpool]|eukprot:XP_003881032.1 conserved hypothetical protein [Neospora caninum Liverpool]